jgi:hypothetical protein
MPRPVVPPNDAAPWIAALRELLSDREAYHGESAASRAAAERFLATLDAADMERYLTCLKQRSEAGPAHATIESLSPEKRALLLERLRKRKGVPL